MRMAPDTDFPERLPRLTAAVLLKAGRPTAVRVDCVRPHGQDVLIKLAGVDSVEQAEGWRGAEVAVPRASAPSLPPGRYYVADVLGLRVQTEAGEALGRVTEILRTGSNDVYVVQGAGREYLIPAISSVVLTMDPAAGVLVIRPLPGLLD